MPHTPRPVKSTKQFYRDFRAAAWDKQGHDHKVDFRASTMLDGSPLDGNYLAPKPILFYKDVWHCPSLQEAKVLIRKLTFMPDIHHIEMKCGRWVYIDYTAPKEGGYNHLLPGQPEDERKRLRG